METTGGIQVINHCGEVDVFVLKSFPKQFKERLASRSNVRLHGVDKAEEICKDVYTTGELGELVKEQSERIIRGGKWMKACVSATSDSLDSLVDPRFGRSPYFIIVDLETMRFEVIPNPASSVMGGAGIQAA